MQKVVCKMGASLLSTMKNTGVFFRRRPRESSSRLSASSRLKRPLLRPLARWLLLCATGGEKFEKPQRHICFVLKLRWTWMILKVYAPQNIIPWLMIKTPYSDPGLLVGLCCRDAPTTHSQRRKGCWHHLLLSSSRRPREAYLKNDWNGTSQPYQDATTAVSTWCLKGGMIRP